MGVFGLHQAGHTRRPDLPVLDGRACTVPISNKSSVPVIIISNSNIDKQKPHSVRGWGGMAKAGRRRPKTLRRSCSGKPREIERPRMGGPFGPPSHPAWAGFERKLHPYLGPFLAFGRIPAPSGRRKRARPYQALLEHFVYVLDQIDRKKTLRCEREYMVRTHVGYAVNSI